MIEYYRYSINHGWANDVPNSNNACRLSFFLIFHMLTSNKEDNNKIILQRANWKSTVAWDIAITINK